ncbi:hypothetical protein A3F37_03015 [Candidatus Saccharibacteria bacterium RIFCSPHIGHO2_12_FULL_41_12]|nr:MAG: hypothetical protein A3F37_03015 [Candidatus Saccharibacteria bacterium RIFCSPHIGHO2_12_FULL_41_12]
MGNHEQRNWLSHNFRRIGAAFLLSTLLAISGSPEQGQAEPRLSPDGYRLMHPLREYNSIQDAIDNICSPFGCDDDPNRITPPLKPDFNDEMKEDYYRSCTVGKLTYPLVEGNGIEFSRKDDNTVQLSVNLNRSCKDTTKHFLFTTKYKTDKMTKFEESNTIIGEVDYVPNDVEYGGQYLWTSSTSRESCKKDSSLVVRPVIYSINFSNYAPIIETIRREKEKNIPEVGCSK